jgi:anti-sigma-K factor RskA
MISQSKSGYVTLQACAPSEEEVALERAVASAMAPVSPDTEFVDELSQRLIAEAQRQEMLLRHHHQFWRAIAVMAGALASIVGAVSLWLFWRQRRS